MSQKPRAGDKAKPALLVNVAKDPAPKIDPVKVETASDSKPVPPLESVVTPPPVLKPSSVTETHPVMSGRSEIGAKPSSKVIEAPSTVVKAPIPVAVKPLASASEPLPAAARSVAAVTAKAIESASATEPAKSTITQGMKSMMKSTEDLVAFGQANMEAFVKSGQIWSAGVQELTKQIASSAKASFDESVSTFKAISTARSVKEAMDLQSTFAKAALEKAMAESNKLTDASIKLTEQTLAPITARVTVAVESFGKTH